MPRSHAVTRLPLALLLLLFACDVSRDLRPELFACDAGGLCGPQDSGVTIVNCPFGNLCRCNEGKACQFRCAGECDIECLAGSSCEVLCQTASCTTLCSSGAECKVRCTAASCDTICEESSDCQLDCPIGSQCTCSGPECPF